MSQGGIIMKRNWIHVLTIFLLIFSLLTPGLALPDQSAAATPTDVTGHWAYTYIARGIELGFIAGYPDGKFLPDKAVSRAEFAKMVNAALGNMGTASSSFKDVPTFEWFYNDVSKAVAATYVDGYGDGVFLPNSPISRQEAAAMIARIVPSYGFSANLNAYTDGSKTADWAKEYMTKIVGKTYLGAYDDGLLHPEDSLTRAQTAKIICNILDNENIVKTFTTIKTDATVIKNTIYANPVTLSKDLGEGDVAFQNCTLLGGLFVNGGGHSTITLENSRITQVNVNKTGSTVRVLAKGATVIPRTVTQELCSLETYSLAGGTFGKGFVSVDVSKNADTTFTGYFPSINLLGSNIIARLEGCSVDKLVIISDAKNSNIHLDSRSKLETTDVYAIVAFHGTGIIKQMNANVSGITYETKPNNWTLASGVVAPKEAAPDLTTTFTPSNGIAGIAITVKPTIKFSTEIETFRGDVVSAAYLNNNLVFKKDSANGVNVSFSAVIASDKKTITITPAVNLDLTQVYYLGFAKDIYRAVSSKESMPAKSVVFTTAAPAPITPTVPAVTFTPINGNVQFATTGSLAITFSEAVYTRVGTAVTPEYLADNVTIIKDSAGANLNTTASSISTNKDVITIPAPTAGWDVGASYTITVLGSAFKNLAGTYVVQKASSFTVYKPDALLTSLTYTYILSGGAVVLDTLAISSSMTLDIPADSTGISIAAIAAAGVLTECSGVTSVTGPDPLMRTIDMSTMLAGDSISITITTSKASHTTKGYTLAFRKTL